MSNQFHRQSNHRNRNLRADPSSHELESSADHRPDASINAPPAVNVVPANQRHRRKRRKHELQYDTSDSQRSYTAATSSYAASATSSGRSLNNRGRNRFPAHSTSHPVRMLTDALMVRAAAAVAHSTSSSDSDDDVSHPPPLPSAPKGSNHVQNEDSSSSGSDFLLSQAEIKEKKLRKLQQQQSLQSASSSSNSSQPGHHPPRARLHMPGYHFDAVKNKYFKLLPSHIHTAAAGNDADEGNARGEVDSDSNDFSPLHRRSSADRSTPLFASLRITGDPRLRAQSVHAHLSSTATQLSGSAKQREKKRQKMDTSVSLTRPPVIHTSPTTLFERSTNMILNLHARASFCNVSSIPSTLRLREHIPGLLSPLPNSFLQHCTRIGEGNEELLSAEHALSYERYGRLLTLAGRRRWEDRFAGEEISNGSFLRCYRLRALNPFEHRRMHPSDLNLSRSLSVSLQLLCSWQSASPITSLHQFSSWSMRAPSGRMPGNAWDSERRWRQAARQRSNENLLHPTEEQDDDEERPVSNLIACTQLGAERVAGSFSLYRPDLTRPSCQQPLTLMSHVLSEGSIWCSAFPYSIQSLSTSSLLPATVPCKVSLGCSKGAWVLDLETERRIHRCWTGKSDVLAQTWLKRTGTVNDTLLLNGLRNGSVWLDDTRVKTNSTTSAHSNVISDSNPPLSLKLSSSPCFLQQLEDNEHHLVAASVDGQVSAQKHLNVCLCLHGAMMHC
jgi:hypothetical protein